MALMMVVVFSQRYGAPCLILQCFTTRRQILRMVYQSIVSETVCSWL